MASVCMLSVIQIKLLEIVKKRRKLIRIKMSANFVNFRTTLVVALISVIFFGDNFIGVHSFELNPSGYACKIDFKDKEDKVKVILDCATKVNYKFPTEITLDSIQAEMKRLAASDYDDMCFGKCWYETTNLLETDGKVITAKFADFFKTSNIKEPLLKEYTKLFEDCVKETEPKFKDSKEIPCKMYTMIDACLVQKFVDQKAKLEEICTK